MALGPPHRTGNPKPPYTQRPNRTPEPGPASEPRPPGSPATLAALPSELPGLPASPASVVTTPPGVTFRIVWFDVSATYTFPFLSTVTPKGESNRADAPVPSAAPPCPALPASVLTSPAAVIFRMT